jgi:hypothetical protein
MLLPRLRIRVKTPISLPEQYWMAYTAYYLKHDYVFVVQKGMHTEVWRVLGGGPKDLRVLHNTRCEKSRLRVWDVN